MTGAMTMDELRDVLGDIREFMGRHEAKLDGINEKLEKQNGRVSKLEEAHTDIKERVDEARGAWRAISAVSALIGGGAAWAIKHFLPLLLISLGAQAALVTVTDTLRTVTGDLFEGDIVVSLNSPGTSMPLYNDLGQSLTGWQKTARVVSGAFSMELEANDVITPGGTSYSARYIPKKGTGYTETWIAATSATPIKVYTMRSTTIPTTRVMFTPSQITQASAATGYFLRWGGTAWESSIIRLSSAAPATSSDACSAGTAAFDSSYVYICTATNTWKRAALGSF